MQLGMVGLGRMGANMARRLLGDGHACVVYDLNPSNVEMLAQQGAVGAGSLGELVDTLAAPRAVWVMVPAGVATDQTVAGLAKHLERDDIVIDGGNTYYKDDIRRHAVLKAKGIQYVDVGTSGGVSGSGAERGYCSCRITPSLAWHARLLLLGLDPTLATCPNFGVHLSPTTKTTFAGTRYSRPRGSSTSMSGRAGGVGGGTGLLHDGWR